MRLVATQKAKIACEARLVLFFRLPYALPILFTYEKLANDAREIYESRLISCV